MIRFPGRIPISIHPAFFLMAGLIAVLMRMGNFMEALLVLPVIFVSIFWHEMGHALTALYFGQKVRINFEALGGMTYRQGPRLKLWQEFLVVLNGPLFGFSLLFFSLLILALNPKPGPTLGVLLFSSIYINLVWTLLNLIPVGPLDGGRLLGITLEGAFGFQGVRLNFLIGTILGVTVGATAFFFFKQPIIGLLFFLLAFESFRGWQMALPMREQDRDEDLQQLFQEGERAYHEGDFSHAYDAFQALREQAEEGILYTGATEYLARIMSDQGEFEEAYSLLLPLERELSFESLRLLQRLSYYARDCEVVVRVGQRCYQQQPLYDVAFLNALAHALLNQPREAMSWLRSARREGMPNFREGLEKREFDSIREEEEFQTLRDTLGEE